MTSITTYTWDQRIARYSLLAIIGATLVLTASLALGYTPDWATVHTGTTAILSFFGASALDQLTTYLRPQTTTWSITHFDGSRTREYDFMAGPHHARHHLSLTTTTRATKHRPSRSSLTLSWHIYNDSALPF